MLLHYKKREYFLDKSIDVLFSSKLSCLFFKGKNGYVKILLPSYYFYTSNNGNNFSLLFLNNYFYTSVLANISVFTKKLNFFYFLKLRLRGLGFRIRMVSSKLCYFRFAYINKFYFHIPKEILVKAYKKRIFLFSYDWSKLRLVFTHLLLLKKAGPYRMLGNFVFEQIIQAKKLKKNF
jgi:ribosomal protein L6P/L9E